MQYMSQRLSKVGGKNMQIMVIYREEICTDTMIVFVNAETNAMR